MKENVIISVIGMQVVQNTDENVEIVAPGRYSYEGEEHHISYEDTDEENGEITNNLIKARPGFVEVERTGMVNTKLTFENGKTSQSIYSTPYGDMLIEIKTDSIHVQHKKESVRISVQYETYLNSAKVSDNNIVVKVQNQMI